MMVELDETTPVFAITAAAELAGMHPQTLRQYDRLGLVSPRRTAGRSRRYSMRDVVHLSERVRELEAALADEMLNRPGRRVFAAGSEGEVVSLRAGTRVRRSNQVVVWRPLDR